MIILLLKCITVSIKNCVKIIPSLLATCFYLNLVFSEVTQPVCKGSMERSAWEKGKTNQYLLRENGNKTVQIYNTADTLLKLDHVGFFFVQSCSIWDLTFVFERSILSISKWHFVQTEYKRKRKEKAHMPINWPMNAFGPPNINNARKVGSEIVGFHMRTENTLSLGVKMGPLCSFPLSRKCPPFYANRYFFGTKIAV